MFLSDKTQNNLLVTKLLAHRVICRQTDIRIWDNHFQFWKTYDFQKFLTTNYEL